MQPYAAAAEAAAAFLHFGHTLLFRFLPGMGETSIEMHEFVISTSFPPAFPWGTRVVHTIHKVFHTLLCELLPQFFAENPCKIYVKCYFCEKIHKSVFCRKYPPSRRFSTTLRREPFP